MKYFAYVVAVLMISHLAQILLFSIFYVVLSDESNFLSGNLDNNFIDYFYFSLSSYSTLGIGDVYPVGNLKIISGIEALLGLIMIAWSATLNFSMLMRLNKS